ncbi:hypothetical protein BN903_99 [Halorubrum sp. AJ67]|nr:hypothetical protein BN903_99 [Halorubrum sp. AJ67]
MNGSVRSIWTSPPCDSRSRSARNAAYTVSSNNAARPNRRATTDSWRRHRFRRPVRAAAEYVTTNNTPAADRSQNLAVPNRKVSVSANDRDSPPGGRDS